MTPEWHHVAWVNSGGYRGSFKWRRKPSIGKGLAKCETLPASKPINSGLRFQENIPSILRCRAMLPGIQHPAIIRLSLQHPQQPLGDTAKARSMSKSGSDLFIVDNSDSDWKVHRYLKEWCQLSKAIDVATGFFEVGGLLTLDGSWQTVPEIRILMGDEVSRRTKQAFADGLTEIAARLDRSIDEEKAKDDFIQGVPAIVAALRSGQIKFRVYRKDKFHANAYITHAQSEVVGSAALVGSSNLTHPGNRVPPRTRPRLHHHLG